MSTDLAIGIDLGGTNIKGALIDCSTGAAADVLVLPTLDGEFDGCIPRFATTVRGMVAAFESLAGIGPLPVGLSAPGLARPDGRCITWMPGRMDGLENFDWPNHLQRDVKVLNDAQAALLGELWLGAARGCHDAFMITLGTGVGGAVMSGGRLLKGAIGRAGHLGHISTDAFGPLDVFHTPGSLEAAIGNHTVAARTGGRYASTLELIAAVRTGDQGAETLWEKSLRQLGAGIASLINVLDPEVVILGGGIATGAGDLLFDRLQAVLDEFEWRPGGHRVRLAPATLGDRAGAFGSVYHFLLGQSIPHVSR
jgi:glucokinase